MKKQATKKWLLPLVVLMVLIATVGMVMAGCKQEPQQQPGGTATPGASALYWNLDREMYIDPDTGLSLREKDENGKFMMRFLLDGQIVNLEIVDKQLVNFIDSKTIWGLVFDDNGVVIDVIEAKDAATEIAKEFFVVTQENGILTLNSSQLMNGMKVEVSITEKTKIYNMDPTIGEIGAEVACELMDKVYVYGNAEGEATHVFLSSRPAKSDAYFRMDNMERLYNTSTGQSTRVPDENGVYTIPLAWEGEIVQVKTKSKALCNEIDAYEAQSCAAFGLKFDDEGYAIEELELTLATRTTRRAENYTVTAIDGNTVSLEMMWSTSSKLGQTDTITLADDCDFFLCETDCTAKFCGERVDNLQVGDRIYAFANMDGEVVLVYIVKRMVDWDIYYWPTYIGTTKGLSNAPKDKNGYYVFDNMYGNGKVQTLKTKDDALAAKLSRFWARNAGLIVENGIIVDACELSCISGRANIGTPRYVTGTIGPIWQFAGETDPSNPSNHMLTEDLRVYDFTTSYGAKPGKATDLRIGDKVHAYRHPNDMMRLILVIQRWEKDAPLAVNQDMKWDYTNLCSKRQPGEDGYYTFQFIINGKEVFGKTKDKKLVNYIDKERFLAVKVDKNGIIKEAHPATYAFEYGASVLGYVYYDSTNADGTVNYYYGTGNFGNKEYYRTTTQKVTKKTKVYNTSPVFTDHLGEATKLKKGDYIQGYYNVATGEIQQIIVRERKVISKLYMSTTLYSRVDGVTTRPTDENGYYVFELLAEGKKYTFRTKDVKVASSLDSRSALPFGLELKGDIIIQDYDVTNVMGVQGWVAYQWDLKSVNMKKGTAKIIMTKKDDASYGKITEITLSPTIKCYNMDRSSPNYGKEQLPKPGDRLNIFANGKWTSEYVFIISEHGRAAGAWSDCEHCGQEVYWEAYNGTFVPDAEGEHGHYYMPKDDYWSSPRTVGYTAEQLAADTSLKQWDIVLDLNGKVFDARGGLATINSAFTLIDSQGTGAVQSAYRTATSESAPVFNVLPGAELIIDGAKLVYSPDYNFAQLGGFARTENGTITIKNSTVVDAKTEKSAIYVGNGGVLNIENTKFTAKKATGASVYAAEGATVNLKGKVEMSGLHLDAGILLDVSELTAGSAIALDATGVFTTECENAEAAKAYFTALYSEEKQIDIVGNTLSVGAFYNPFTEALVLSETNTAYCPVCEAEVTWVALTDAATVAAAEHEHYYLAADLTYTGTTALITAPAGTNVCLHLNGYKLIAEQAEVISTTGGNVDVFGKGTATANSANVVKIENGAVTLHTGNYKAQNVVAAIGEKGGKLTVLKRAGVVSAGETAITVGAAKETNAELTVREATVTGGIVVDNLNTENGKTSVVTLEDAQILGTVKVGKISELKLLGLTEMPVLDLTSGMKIALGDLSKEAKIAVLADGAFTVADEKAGEYLGVFSAAPGYMPISVREQALYTFHCSKVDNSNLTFAEGTQNAECSICGKVVEWLAITGEEAYIELQPGKHYYLANDITVDAQAAMEAGKNAYIYTADMKLADQVCLHLNGKSLVVSNMRAISVSAGSVNVFGNGLVSGKATEKGGSIQVSGGSFFSMFGGTVTGGKSTGDAGNVYVSAGSTMTMAGGAITEGEAAYGGNIYVTHGSTFNMYGGTISGGIASVNGGNIYADNTAAINIMNATITNGTAANHGGNIATAAPLNIDTSVISGGTATQMGGNIYSNGGADIVISNSEIKDGKAVYGANAHFTENSGGAGSQVVMQNTIIGATRESDGVFSLGVYWGSKVVMNGGSISGADEAVRLAGDTNDPSQLILAGTATVSGRLYVDGKSTLVLDTSWTGKSTVHFAKTFILGKPLMNSDTLPAAVVAKLESGTAFTAGGTFAGTLTSGKNKVVVLDETSGQLTLAQGEVEEEEPQTPVWYKINDTVHMDVANKVIAEHDASCTTCQPLPANYCPYCGEVTWTVAEDKSYPVTSSTLHLKVSGALTTTKGWPVDIMGEYSKVHIQLDNADWTLDHTNGTILFNSNNVGHDLRIFGTGSVKTTSSAYGVITIQGKEHTVELVGGTYSSADGKNSVTCRLDRITGSGTTINVYGGTVLTHGIRADQAEVNIYGGRVEASGTRAIDLLNGSTLNVFGGTISGGVSEGDGGNIYVSNGSAMTMSGGTITGGNAKYGGNIYVTGTSSLTMTGGTISAGVATANGGNIFADATAAISIKNATITGGSATSGGNICTAAAFEIVNTEISGGTATNFGGNIYRAGGEAATIAGSEIKDGKAAYGANLHLHENASGVGSVLILNNTTIGATRESEEVFNVGVYWGSKLAMIGGSINSEGVTVRLAGDTNDPSQMALVGTAVVGGNIFVDGKSTLALDKDWTGSADLTFAKEIAAGAPLMNSETLPIAVVGTLNADNTFTVGGALAGTLTNAGKAVALLDAANGLLTVPAIAE